MGMISVKMAYRKIDKVLNNPNGLLSSGIRCDMNGLFSKFSPEDMANAIRVLSRTVDIKNTSDSKLLALLAEDCIRRGYENKWLIKEYAEFIEIE